MKVLIVDNYDSFTFNLSHYVEKCGAIATVIRNDELDFDSVLQYDRLILSPGPGLPSETVLMYELIKTYTGKLPILGVCLGMQGIAEFYGGSLVNQEVVKHGVQTVLTLQNDSVLYHGISSGFKVGLYHSWCVKIEDLPKNFTITSVSSEGVLMSIEDKERKLFAVQYHPESILTENGLAIISNFLNVENF